MSTMFTKIMIAMQIVGGLAMLYGGLTGSLDPGAMTSTGLAVAGASVALIGIVCFALVTKTSLRHDSLFWASLTASMVAFCLQGPDIVSGIMATICLVSLGVSLRRDVQKPRSMLR